MQSLGNHSCSSRGRSSVGAADQFPRNGINIKAGTTIALSGTVVLSDANGFQFGMSTVIGSTTITASAGGAGLAVSANTTLGSSGQMVLSNSNGINFGANGQTITGKPVALSYWDNQQGASNVSDQTFIYVHRAVLSRELNVTRADLVVSLTTNAGSQYTISIGVYTMGGTTASLASSTSLGVTWTNTNSSAQIGQLWRTQPVSFALTPGDYLFAVGWSYSTAAFGFVSFLGTQGPDLGAGAASIASSPDYFADGAIATGGVFASSLPSSMAASNINMTNSDGGRIGIPYMRLVGTY